MTDSKILEFDYVNWKGEQSRRRVKPLSIRFGQTQYHPTPQWFMEAFDLDKEAYRDFALDDIKGKNAQ